MNLKNGFVEVNGAKMYYAAFGSGEKSAVVIPGLSEALTPVKGKALGLSGPYRAYTDRYRVYMFGRRESLPEGYTIADMAEDQAAAMYALGINGAYVLGVSEGGMIAQLLAAKHPDHVSRLVLAVTAPCVNDTIRGAVALWEDDARRGDHTALLRHTFELGYSDRFLAKYGKFLPAMGLVTKPSDYGRFLVNTAAISEFDARGELHRIKCPTLIIGGDADKTVGTEAAAQLKELISGSRLCIYKGLGHALYDEARDFYRRVFGFFESPVFDNFSEGE